MNKIKKATILLLTLNSFMCATTTSFAKEEKRKDEALAELINAKNKQATTNKKGMKKADSKTEKEWQILGILPENNIKVGEKGVIIVQKKATNPKDNPIVIKTEDITFKSSNEDVLSVNAKGEWVAKKEGNTMLSISFTYKDVSNNGKTIGLTFEETAQVSGKIDSGNTENDDGTKDKDKDNNKDNDKDKNDDKGNESDKDKDNGTGKDNDKDKGENETTENIKEDEGDYAFKIKNAKASLKVGEKGKYEAEFSDFDGIENVTGTVTYYSSNEEVLKVSKDGNWEAVGFGMAQVSMVHEYSEETMKKWQEKYPGKEFKYPDVARVLDVRVESNIFSFVPSFIQTGLNSRVSVGETGKLVTKMASLEKIENPIIEVKYYSSDDRIITIDKEGNWIAKAPGKANISFDYNISDSTWEEIKRVHNVTDIAIAKKSNPVIEVNVVGKAGSTVKPPAGKSEPTKKLPQTNEKNGYGIASILGSSILIGCLFLLKKIK